ncbi:glycosyl hydrolase family 18 protein [Paenibacillus caui]|uniref:glycosyl hydrolase family 18 protein n=1 Tax=Paenibacillus caui TaxID=2873927 RepID=UPI001CA93DA9|nr:glycosyl hydrolase family 18 protein [Paenibacillus caui]
MTRTNRRRRRNKRPLRKFALLLIFALSAFIAYRIFMPNGSHIDPVWKNLSKPIFFGSEAAAYSATGSGSTLSLPLPVVQKELDETARYESDSGSVIFTTPDKLVHVKVGQTAGQMNRRKLQLTVAPSKKEGIVYVPADLLEQIYGVHIAEDRASGAVRVFLPGESIQNAAVKPDKKGSTTPLRQSDSIHAPILADVPPGAHLRILNTAGNWYYAQTDSGYAGFIRAKSVKTADKTMIPKREIKAIPAVQAWEGKRINLTWEAVYRRPADPSVIDNLPGANVVSPTWFQLANADGNVKSKADAAYVKRAHSLGIQVWGLYTNSFNADLTAKAFAGLESRLQSINELLEYAKQYQLDGINIDFENVHTKDGLSITQFMRELRPLAREQGLIVSIDVTPKSNSEMWSKFLDRRSLSEIVDFMFVMAYDEHWAASPVAGSVASLPWTEAVVNKILAEDHVPPSKLILGVPLYTRVWSEETVKGETKVTSKAIGMSTAQRIIEQFSLKPVLSADTRQNYVEYKEAGVVKKIWLEDTESLQQRVELVKRLRLGGIASWNRSFASNEAWNVLSQVNE